MPERIFRLKELVILLGLSKSTIYERIRNGVLPKPISLGGSAKGWIGSEIEHILKCMVAGYSQKQLSKEVLSIHERRSNDLDSLFGGLR